MPRMIRVLESDPPDTGYLAEVPGRAGRFVRASTLPELRSLLQAALEADDGGSFAPASEPRRPEGVSGTAIYLRL